MDILPLSALQSNLPVVVETYKIRVNAFHRSSRTALVTPPGLEPGFPPWKGGVLDRLDDGAIMRGLSPRRWTRPIRCDLIVKLLSSVAKPAQWPNYRWYSRTTTFTELCGFLLPTIFSLMVTVSLWPYNHWSPHGGSNSDFSLERATS